MKVTVEIQGKGNVCWPVITVGKRRYPLRKMVFSNALDALEQGRLIAMELQERLILR